jgi:osmoprotectant transport system permease protein
VKRDGKADVNENFVQNLEILPTNLSNHLMITVVPLGAGLIISVFIAISVIRWPVFRYPVLTAVSVVQTIPSLALLALMVPLLGMLGFWPTVIALTMYSMLPITRNTVTGILEVDPPIVEAARGVGMTPRQVLWRVELPLAMPVIIAGIRTATVWVVGIATLATPVGQPCLGNYIFRGLQTMNWTMVTFGCVAAAALAIVLDLLIGGVERAVKDRRRSLTLVCGIALLAVFGGGLVAPSVVRALKQRGQAERPVVWIGSKTFTEQFILADLIADLIEEAGYTAREKGGLGSTVIFDSLSAGEIDCYVDYTGTIWANYMKRERAADSETVLREVSRWLEANHGIRCIGGLGFENAYGLAMKRERADQLGIETIGDLRAHAPDMKIGGDYEFFGRPEWHAIKNSYNIEFLEQTSYDSTFMYQAVDRGAVDVISAFTTDGRIAAFDLVILDDPKNAIPPYDAVLLLSEHAAEKDELVAAVQPLVGAISVETMRRANYLVDREKDKKTVAAAADWLRKTTLDESPVTASEPASSATTPVAP